MKALTFNPANDQFGLKNLPIPEISSTEILVKVEACGLNPVDAKIRYWKGMVKDFINSDWVVGLDVAGTIEQVGSAVTNWSVGDKVLYHGNMLKPHGGLAEYAVHDQDTLLPLPAGKSMAEAAATPCAGWTAWRALVDKLHVNKNDSLLIIGASGGVGSFAVQIAKNVLHCRQVIAVNSTTNVEFVKSLGADHIIDYKKEDVLVKVNDYTHGIGVEKSFDTVGGDNDIIAANALAFEGEMLELVGTIRADKYNNVFLRGLTFHQLSLGAGHSNGEKGKATIVNAGKGFNKAFEEGKIKVPKINTISLEQAGNALEEMLKQRTVGKIVVEM